MHSTRSHPGTVIGPLCLLAMLILLLPAAAGAAPERATPGADDPDYVGKWDFEQPGAYDGWKPLQKKGVFYPVGDLVKVTAQSKRPCLDLTGSYSAASISVIEIRIRGILLEREKPEGSSPSSMGDMGGRVRVVPGLYRGSRLYFTRAAGEKYDEARSFELVFPLDGAFHVLTITPGEDPAWQGLIKKFRLDIGDFPNRYELDYIHFRRHAAGASTTETKK